MADRFQPCLAETLKWEGNWSNDPYDPGGPTMRGVIQKVYDGYRDDNGLPRRSVREIEEHELLAIYRKNYWEPIRGADLLPGVDLVLLDFCINSGPSQAVVSMQRVLGLSRDGHFGAATMAALKARHPTDFIEAYMDERRRFLRGLKTFWRFGKGWLRRCDGVEKAAAFMSGHLVIPAADPPKPLEDGDAQSAEQGRAVSSAPSPPVAAGATIATTGAVSIMQAGPAVIAKAASQTGKLTPMSLAIAILTEPWFWAGMACLWAAVATFLWRRKHA